MERVLAEVKTVQVRHLGQSLIQQDRGCVQRGKLEADTHPWRVLCGKHHAENTTGGDGDLPSISHRERPRKSLCSHSSEETSPLHHLDCHLPASTAVSQ